jgi:hypothetical protein
VHTLSEVEVSSSFRPTKHGLYVKKVTPLNPYHVLFVKFIIKVTVP